MPLCWTILDWLKYLLLACAGILGAITLSTPTGKQRGKLVLGAALLFGLGTVLGASLGIYARVHSPRPTLTGTIMGLHQYHGRSSHSEFYLAQSGQDPEFIETTYSGGFIDNGTRVTVQVLAYDRATLSLIVLDGQYAGFQHTESDGVVLDECVLLFGIAVLFVAPLRWRANPEAVVPEATSSANSQSLSDVDSASLLHLGPQAPQDDSQKSLFSSLP